jgi:Domain of unknown function (DUF3576)
MSLRYYRLLLGVAASLSLLTAGCGSNRPETAADPVTGKMPTAPVAQRKSDEPDTQATLWTVLGLAKSPSEGNVGPQTGNSVSPILWQATLDTLHFAGVNAEDPMTGLYRTNWYSPPGTAAERLRVTVFVLSRALRSDSVAVTVEREVQSPAGQWQVTPIARDVVTGIENAILLRARQIHAERYRANVYK